MPALPAVHCPHPAVPSMTLQNGKTGFVQPFAGAPASFAPGRTQVTHVSNVVSPALTSHTPAVHADCAASHCTHSSKLGLPAPVSQIEVVPVHWLESAKSHWTHVSNAGSVRTVSHTCVAVQLPAFAASHRTHVPRRGSVATSSQMSGVAHPTVDAQTWHVPYVGSVGTRSQSVSPGLAPFATVQSESDAQAIVFMHMQAGFEPRKRSTPASAHPASAPHTAASNPLGSASLASSVEASSPDASAEASIVGASSVAGASSDPGGDASVPASCENNDESLASTAGDPS